MKGKWLKVNSFRELKEAMLEHGGEYVSRDSPIRRRIGFRRRVPRCGMVGWVLLPLTRLRESIGRGELSAREVGEMSTYEGRKRFARRMSR